MGVVSPARGATTMAAPPAMKLVIWVRARDRRPSGKKEVGEAAGRRVRRGWGRSPTDKEGGVGRSSASWRVGNDGRKEAGGGECCTREGEDEKNRKRIGAGERCVTNDNGG